MHASAAHQLGMNLYRCVSVRADPPYSRRVSTVYILLAGVIIGKSVINIIIVIAGGDVCALYATYDRVAGQSDD